MIRHFIRKWLHVLEPANIPSSSVDAPPTAASDAQATASNISDLVADARYNWLQVRERAARGPKILIATNVPGLHHVSSVEGLLAIALTLRGADVHVLLCDAVLPGCLRAGPDNVKDPATFARYELPQTICPGCLNAGEQTFGPLGLTTHRLGSLLTADDRGNAREIAAKVPFNEIRSFRLDGLAVGEHAYAGTLRYYARGDLEKAELAETTLRRYLEASILMVRAVDALTKKIKFHSSCFHHGIYVPQGLVGEVMRQNKIPVTTWNPAYRQNTFIFSHNDSYHHTMLSEDPHVWRDMPWNSGMETEVMAYLNSRRLGTRDWIWFHEKPVEDYRIFERELGLDPGKPTVGLLTNVMWDAQLHFAANAFANMREWVFETIRYFAMRPELQLLIRIHPAEIRGTTPTRQPLLAEIQQAFPTLPANVFVIPPESQTSTYAAMERCDSVIIYGTKTGVELSSLGIPVVVGGEAWIRNKGLTLDASSPQQYRELLDKLPIGKRMDAETTQNARKYAYHFFFRRMIPLPFLVPQKGKIYSVAVPGLQSLGPGCYPGLDVICDGILKGVPFVYRAETLGIHDRRLESVA